MAFTVSMPDPAEQVYQVVFRCDGLKGTSHDFTMPVWSPGYYGTFDYAGNVRDFRAEDGTGNPLPWKKTTDNTWTVRSDQADTIVLHYGVKAATPFVAQSYLDENRAYILATGLCLFLDDQIRHPVTIEIIPNPQWSTIATGLDPVSKDTPHTYYAPDFDILYDSPILMGNLEWLPPFEIQGVPHYFAGYGMADFDGDALMNDLKSVLEEAVEIFGDIPYPHYTFLAIGPGKGGIEHLNSTAVSFTGQGVDSREEKIRALMFLGHEYFHHYNVKRIRPIALGPFDYDKPNPTNMLWVSEGFTVYYQFLMMARAGFDTQEQFLENMRRNIAILENNPGRLFQSATESSYESWTQGPFGEGHGSGIRKTISYYGKGTVLAFLLDLKIRHETKNKKSLDDVMRKLYKTFYKKKQRGFTDDEFREVCQSVAGCDLQEVFDYASTTCPVDYPKYLAYAGLELQAPELLPEPYLGALTEDQNGTLVIAAVEPGSPAQKAGLTAMDAIESIDGEPVDAKTFNETVAAKQPGDSIEISFSRDNRPGKLNVTLENKLDKHFDMKPVSDPTPLQVDILQTLTQ